MVGFDRHSNDICNLGTQYNGVVEMYNHNFEWSVHNYETEKPSNPYTLLQNLDSNDGYTIPSNLTESIDRCNDFEGLLTQLTQIVSNNDATNDRMDESDSDRPLDDKSTDGDQSSDNDGDVDGKPVAIGDGNINYHSNVISYLDYTEETQEDFVFMRDTSSVRTALWNANNPAYLKSG
ncbi:hypothetical protein HAX54_011576 [Datura stramonium]|uniref:Uncharacterized protein n=1 Tax=Datura stramonium TaxID=4076 RepID=A0ABS8Y0I4_DATST|nr:hypothetical protein [Datura stramonium]